jgi:hypothetical protein
VTAFVNKTPVPHLADFIDAVGELITAVFDVDGGITVGNVTAINIGNA